MKFDENDTPTRLMAEAAIGEDGLALASAAADFLAPLLEQLPPGYSLRLEASHKQSVYGDPHRDSKLEVERQNTGSASFVLMGDVRPDTAAKYVTELYVLSVYPTVTRPLRRSRSD